MSEIAFAAPEISDRPIEAPTDPEPVRLDAGPKRQLDLFALSAVQSDGRETVESGGAADGGAPGSGEGAIEPVRTVLEGVIDLAFKEPDGWVIADYKTDVGTDPDFSSREETYKRQVDLYADAWEKLTGEAVKERVLFFTSQKRVEHW